MMTRETFANAVSQQLFAPPFRDKAGKSWWDWKGTVATEKTSNSATEQTFGFTGFGAAQAMTSLNQQVPMVDMEELSTTTWTHTTYMLGFQLPQELIEDDKYIGFATEGGSALGESHAYVRDLAVETVFTNSFSGSSYYVFDSASLCAAHTMKSGDTVTNLGSSLSLNFTNVWTAAKYFLYGMKTQKGLPMKGVPKYLKFHPSKLDAATLVALNEMEPDSADRNMNTLKKHYALQLVPSMLQSSTTAWWIMDEEFKNDLIFYNRIAPTVDDGADFSRYGIMYRSRQRFSVKPRNFVHIWGTAGS